jgi:class 3 adenylate cyclase/tetratricopeptide (TPR) repeat protein
VPPPRASGTRGTEAEQRQISVLHCDLVTPDGLDAEALHALLNDFFELAQQQIQRYEGTVHQFLGNGFMALFGAPVAVEDHAGRAVLAALDLQGALGEDPAARVTARMGIATGPVVMGGVGDMVVGETPDLAARLQQQAVPGSVLLGETTARLVRGTVSLETASPLHWGKDKVAVYRVLRTAPRGMGTTPARRGTLTPFVGRQRELESLEALFQQATAGHGQVVGIAGEAGAGKSRLVYEFRGRLRSLSQEPVVHLTGQCVSYGAGVPYLPMISMVRHASNIAEADPPEVMANKMRTSLEDVGCDVEASLPYFLNLLGVPPGSHPATEALVGLEAQAIQHRTFTAMRSMVLQASRRAPVVLDLEDLHWIDETSEDFLASLVEALPAARIAVLATYRAGYRPRWMDKSYATQITLRRLSDAEGETVVRNVLGLDAAVAIPTDLARGVLTKAEGNPFFLEELARAVAEQRERGDAAGVPDTVQGILMARIDRLPEDHKRLLYTAAVLGREVPGELLAEVWGEVAPEAPPPEDLLADLKRWEFLYEDEDEGRSTYTFKHALTQEVTYQGLLEGRRKKIHAAVGTALERLHGDRQEDVYDRLMYHYSRAGDPAKSVQYLTLFAAKAARGFAHVEAAKALREALEHARNLPEAERDRRQIEILLQLADSLLPLAAFPETLERFESYREPVERLGEPALTARFHFWLAHTHTYLGNQDAVAHHAARAIEAARECGDEATEGQTHYVLGRDGFWAGKFTEGIQNSLRAVVLLERTGEVWWQGQAHWVAGFNHYVLGRFEEALAEMGRARTIGDALEDNRLDTSWSSGYFLASIGDWEAGIEACQGGLERAQDPLNTAAAMGFLGYAYLQKPDLPQAIETLEACVQRLEGTGMQQLLGWFATFLAEAYLLAERPADARRLAEQGLENTQTVKFLYGAGLARRALGEVALAEGEVEEAAQALGAALEEFRVLKVPFEVARTHLDLASLAHTRGDSGALKIHLQAAREGFDSLGVQPYRDKVEALAAALG